VTIHEARLDGFWLHRVLQQETIDSHVVDAASIATSRRRRAKTDKTDKTDGEAINGLASNAATKNDRVLSSLPVASGILVRSPRATTECEFDLAGQIVELARTADRNYEETELTHAIPM
jgi:hypothetical protein